MREFCYCWEKIIKIRFVVITQTISLCSRLQPLGVGIHTHTVPIQNKDALTKARMPYVVLKPT